MNSLVSSGFSHFQDTLQTGSKIYILINIDQYEKNDCDRIFCRIACTAPHCTIFAEPRPLLSSPIKFEEFDFKPSHNFTPLLIVSLGNASCY